MLDSVKQLLLSGLIAYLFCAVPYSLIYGFALGKDIRTEGSKNVGGTNLLRLVGIKGLPGLLLDVFKGYLAVALIRHFVYAGTASMKVLFVILLACVLGHMFSPFLGFKGGKSIAVAGGALMAISFWPGFFFGVVWFASSFFSDMISFGSVLAAVLFPFYAVSFYEKSLGMLDLAVLAAGLVIWAHRENIARILKNEERRLGLWPKVLLASIRAYSRLVHFEVTGLENVPKSGSYMIASNHVGNGDPFLISALVGRVVIFVAKKELWENPFSGYMMWLSQAIKVDRDNPSRETINLAIATVKEDGRVLGIFPEEHRNKHPELGLLPLKTGAAFIATQSGADVLPVFISYPRDDEQGASPKIVFGELIANPDHLSPCAKEQILEHYGVKKTREALHLQITDSLTRLRLK